MHSLFIVILMSSLAVSVLSTNVEQCPGLHLPDLNARTRLMPCKRLPCKLKHNTNTHIELDFTPENDIQDLRNVVNAEVFGVPLPFPGVNGESVCDKIYLASEPDTKAPCPLKAGTKYIYKDSFPVLSIYPQITTKILWGLKSGKKYVTCFQVPAKIVA